MDYVTPANSTFTGPTNVSQASYFGAAGTVPEPAPGNATDTLADRAMMQNQYRNIGGVESLWVNHTTGTAAASTPTGIQWAQINVTGTTITTTPVQEQIYNNGADGLNRFREPWLWTKQGNMALGYTASECSIRGSGYSLCRPTRTVDRFRIPSPNRGKRMLPGVAATSQTGGCGSTCAPWE